MQQEMPQSLFDETSEVIGVVDGVFDLMHWGHIMHLNACKMFCDTLIVCVAGDEYARTKGWDRPVIEEINRLYSVQSLRCVDVAILCDGSVDVVNQIKPDIYFRNEDYVRDPNLDPSIYIQKMPVHYSTTKLIKKIQDNIVGSFDVDGAVCAMLNNCLNIDQNTNFENICREILKLRARAESV